MQVANVAMKEQLELGQAEIADPNIVALTDPLTGLGNRRRLMDKVRKLAAERADDPAPFTVGIANVDGFKPINDLFGLPLLFAIVKYRIRIGPWAVCIEVR